MPSICGLMGTFPLWVEGVNPLIFWASGLVIEDASDQHLNVRLCFFPRFSLTLSWSGGNPSVKHDLSRTLRYWFREMRQSEQDRGYFFSLNLSRLEIATYLVSGLSPIAFEAPI